MLVICSRCFRPLHHPPTTTAAPSVKLFHMCFDRNNGKNTFQHCWKHVMGMNSQSAHFHCGWAIAAATWTLSNLRCTFKISSELKRADLDEAHTGRKAPGFKMHARVERNLAGVELEHVQSMIAIFTHSLRWKWNCFWFQKRGKHMGYPCWRPGYFWRGYLENERNVDEVQHYHHHFWHKICIHLYNSYGGNSEHLFHINNNSKTNTNKMLSISWVRFIYRFSFLF